MEGGGHSATSRLVYRERFGVAIRLIMKCCSINAVRFVVRRREFVGMSKVLDALNDSCSIREKPILCNCQVTAILVKEISEILI